MSKACVKCGYLRQATDTAPDYECPKCGAIYAKAEAALATGKYVPKTNRTKVKQDFAPTAPGIETNTPSTSEKEVPAPTNNARMKITGGRIFSGIAGLLGGYLIYSGLFDTTSDLNPFVAFVGGVVFLFTGFGAFKNGLVDIEDPKPELPTLKESLSDVLKCFEATQHVIGIGTLPVSGIAINEVSREICLIEISHTREGAQVRQRSVPYRDVISVELFSDGNSISKTDRSSQVGGALVGGLLFGGVGAIIGGSSGDIKSSKTIDRIDLRLTINDTRKPLHEVSFRNVKILGGKTDADKAMHSARRWQGIVEAAMRQGDIEEKQPALAPSVDALPNQQSSAYSPIADELKKLSDLESSGILTADEFQQQKQKLLGNKL